ncbi:hypothetical protein RSOLAG22IIIB_14113 [Rhizoctonia solani]|uniref:Uncharacterized protein n=1 Tax=Rhizoctonia solani TaxID=456999 RepID=A0A0K6FUM4_9AGAM|nr:hypothetical protein RSOLAG22IIIB_14113 [Rhizoctonia solani]
MSASNLQGGKQDNFGCWAKKVGLLTEIRELDDVRYQHTPEVHMLNDLLSNSKTVPKWLGDRESPEYKHYKDGTYGPFVSEIPEAIVSNFQISDDDPALDKEVGQCLQPLLSICASAYRPTQVDKRCYLNALLETHWSMQTPKMFHRNKHLLRLPEPASTAAVIPDSSIFFKIGFDQYAGLGRRVVEGCTALHSGDMNAAENVLHWITEYKPDLDLEGARQQVCKGLTVALYQRRALGFTDHFVFGTCHYGQIYLEVVAATWVLSDDEDNKEDSTRTPRMVPPPPRNEKKSQLTCKVQTDNALHPTVIPKNLDKGMDIDDAPGPHQLEGTHNQGKQQVDDAKLIRDLDQRNKISVYRLGTYCTQDVDAVIAFYLLMRRARDLAMEYRKAITTTSVAHMKVIKKTNPQLFDWCNLPPSESKSRADSKASPGSLKERKDCLSIDGLDFHGSKNEAISDDLESDSYISDSDSDSNSALSLGVDIEEITWEGKVSAFLASSYVDSQELPYTAHFPERHVTND